MNSTHHLKYFIRLCYKRCNFVKININLLLSFKSQHIHCTCNVERNQTKTCYVCNRGDNDILQASQKYKQRVKYLIEQHIKKKKGAVTFSIECQIKLVKYNCEGDEEFTKVFLNTEKLLAIDGFNELYDKAMENMNEKLDKYMSDG